MVLAPGAARARRDGARGDGRSAGPPGGPLARRGGEHGAVVQPHGRRARGEPPRDRGLQPQPRGAWWRPAPASCAPRRRASSPSRTTSPPSSPTSGRESSRSTRTAGSRRSTRGPSEILGLAPEAGPGPNARGGPRRLRHAAARRSGGRRARRAARGGTRRRSCASCRRDAGPSPSRPRRSAARASGAIGTVVVIEDLTQILATQRLEAWKEAVERVIHEVKNPLTPWGSPRTRSRRPGRATRRASPTSSPPRST